MRKKNSKISEPKLTTDVKINFAKSCNPETIRRVLREAGYYGRNHMAGNHGSVAHKKPHISAVNRQKHLDFANKHVNKPPQFWGKVLFSDESKFCIFGIKGRKLVWRKQGTALEKETTVKHGGGGVMAANGV
ncbi:transposable element Tc1 transposase [Trichonephila clavipes]|uniref:Transposable element Tc1 transposase n=1 Tax=Trichonephila clavipes TaxID=2585209 RepID=A0A8X6SG15_TRICX|nr:transposable element Tc1 transposase [Trichonephila clavipes]